MKLRNGIYVACISIIVLLTGCNNEKEGITTNSPSVDTGSQSSEIVTPSPTVASTISPSPVPTIESKETPELSTKPITEIQPNEFIPKDIKVGDKIVGLKVTSIERETIEPDSVVIHFEGDLQLKGTFEYYTKEQLAQENFFVYFTLDQSSLSNYPRIKNDNMDYPERIGISNSAKFEDLLGPAGSKGSLEGTFSHFKLVSTPHKPAEGSIELNTATVDKK